MLATDHLVDVNTVGFEVNTFLQFQLTANQSPLFLLRLDQSLPQSEKKDVERGMAETYNLYFCRMVFRLILSVISSKAWDFPQHERASALPDDAGAELLDL